jgi:small subunit ribosomal protein S9e
MGKNYRNHSKTSVMPKRPFEKERLDSELLLIGKYGLKNKREVWRTQYLLTRIRKAARELLTLEPNDPRRLFEGQALIDRMLRIGVLNKTEKELDYVLSLTTQKFLDRRLQTIVHANQFAKSIHQARTLIFQKKIALNKGTRNQIINIPSFVVRKENETKINKLPDKEGETRTKKRTKAKKEKGGEAEE